MNPRFFAATRGQIRALCLLVSVLLVVVFFPFIRWAEQASTRHTSVRSDGLQAEVSRSWMVRTNGSRLQAWKPCWTLFCSAPSASLTIDPSHTPKIDEVTWAHGVEVVLKKEGFSELRDTEIGGRFGKLKCIEAVQYRDATRITSACLNIQSKILSTLEGAPPDIPELYEIVASTQAITNSVR